MQLTFSKESLSQQLIAQEMPYYYMLTVPVKIGNINWYGVATDATHLHLGKYSMLDHNQITFHSFPINDHLLDGIDTELVEKLRWLAQEYYTVAEHEGKIRVYNMQCDMQGIRNFGVYKAPTAFYFEIIPKSNNGYDLNVGMQEADSN